MFEKFSYEISSQQILMKINPREGMPLKWDQIKSFYDEKLKASGWGTNSLVSGIMEQANQGNDLFQTANWQKDKQNVTIVMVTAPTDTSQKQLIVSLSSQ